MLLVIPLVYELGMARLNTGAIFVCIRHPMVQYTALEGLSG